MLMLMLMLRAVTASWHTINGREIMHVSLCVQLSALRARKTKGYRLTVVDSSGIRKIYLGRMDEFKHARTYARTYARNRAMSLGSQSSAYLPGTVH